MGVVDTISATTFPRQGPDLGGRVVVCFNYGPPDLFGTVVRSDREHPLRTIIRLDDGRHVLSTECQRSLPRADLPPAPAPPTRWTLDTAAAVWFVAGLMIGWLVMAGLLAARG